MAKHVNGNGNEWEPTATVTQTKKGPQLKESQLMDLKLMGAQINENLN